MANKDEVLKALHEASLSIACLGSNWYEHCTNITNDINNQHWLVTDVKGLQKDLNHIQDQITILENYLNPYVPKEEN